MDPPEFQDIFGNIIYIFSETIILVGIFLNPLLHQTQVSIITK